MKSGRAGADARRLCDDGVLASLAARTRRPGLRGQSVESVVIRLGFIGKHFVLRGWHGLISLAIAPQDCIKHGGVRCVRMGKVHLGGFASALPLCRIHLVDQIVIAISPVGREWRLIACTRKQRRHQRSITVVLIHRRQTQQGFYGVDQVHGGVEMVVHERVIGRTGRILADHESDRAVSVDVIGAVLSVIFENENRRIVPVGTVRDRLHHATDREVIIGDACGWAGLSRSGAVGVIVGQIKKNERGQFGALGLPCGRERIRQTH